VYITRMPWNATRVANNTKLCSPLLLVTCLPGHGENKFDTGWMDIEPVTGPGITLHVHVHPSEV
jgi:hypothetical protein